MHGCIRAPKGLQKLMHVQTHNLSYLATLLALL